MSQHKLVESLGLKVKKGLIKESNGLNMAFCAVDVVFASEVETLFQNAQKVYGHVNQGKPNYWGPRENGQFNDTHEALLIGIKEIKKEAVKSEFSKEQIAEWHKDWLDSDERFKHGWTFYDYLCFVAFKVKPN